MGGGSGTGAQTSYIKKVRWLEDGSETGPQSPHHTPWDRVTFVPRLFRYQRWCHHRPLLVVEVGLAPPKLFSTSQKRASGGAFSSIHSATQGHTRAPHHLRAPSPRNPPPPPPRSIQS